MAISFGIKWETLKENVELQIASGNIMRVNKIAEIEFEFDKIKNHEVIENTYIIDGPLDLLLLGEAFLIREEIDIDNSEAMVIISNNTSF